jgi:hypothetical protein
VKFQAVLKAFQQHVSREYNRRGKKALIAAFAQKTKENYGSSIPH